MAGVAVEVSFAVGVAAAAGPMPVVVADVRRGRRVVVVGIVWRVLLCVVAYCCVLLHCPRNNILRLCRKK